MTILNMPFIARHDGKRVTPHEVKDGVRLECVKCKEPMHVVSSYKRQKVLVVRHFRHTNNGGTSSGGGCSGGESDLHARVKGIALDHVMQQYDDIAEGGIEVPIDRQIADASVEFSSPRLPYGNGIAIEVQYRNHSKDIEGTEQNHLQHGYSVLWIDAEKDYYPEQNHAINLPEPIPVWPNAVPALPSIDDFRYGEWLFKNYRSAPASHRSMVENALDTVCPSPEVTIHLPHEAYEEAEQRLYRNWTWDGLFRGTEYEMAMAEVGIDAVPKTRVHGSIPFAKWLLQRKDERYVIQLRRAHTRGKETREYGSRAEREEWARKIHSIIVHNTLNTQQPETIAYHTIKIIASHGSLRPREIESGINAAQEWGLIKETEDGRYQSTPD